MEKEASQFKLTPATIRRYIKSGKLKGKKLGVKWFVSEEGISDFFRKPQPRPVVDNSGGAIEQKNKAFLILRRSPNEFRACEW